MAISQKTIQCLTRKQLDVEKYDNCISRAVNTRIYAYSWFLDIVCDDWNVLVKDDYQVVMPLPKRKKYGIYYIYQVPWTQQLGIFSETSIDKSTVHQFIKSIPKKFKLIDVFLNTANFTDSPIIKLRQNFILLLDHSYETLRKQYSKGRRSSIKKGQKFDLDIVESSEYDKIIKLFKENKGIELHKKAADYDVLRNLVKQALQLNYAKSYAVINSKNEIVGGAFFLKDKHRITYLFSAINNEGREKQAMSLLIDYVIKRNAQSKYILDFEGSMVKELASFFKSFGADKEEYYHYKKWHLF